MATDPSGLSTTQDPNKALQPIQPLATPAGITAVGTPAVNTPTLTNNALPGGMITSPQLGSTPAVTATGMIPTTRQIDPATGTVAGQFDALTKSNSPLMTMARTNSDLQMNSRGLLNSSLASSASDLAAYQAALPIANADATNYNTVGAQNQAAVNAASSQNATAANQASMFSSDQAFKTGMANLDSQTKSNLADIEANYKTLMQTSSSAAQLYQQTVTNLSNISLSTMDQTAKDTAVANQYHLLRQGMAAMGAIGNLNLGNLLTYTTPNTEVPTPNTEIPGAMLWQQLAGATFNG